MINKPHTAPTEEQELVIINFCLDKLNLSFGEFWYKWFSSSRVKNNGNHTVHIDTNTKLDINLVKKEFSTLPFFVSMLEIKEINVHSCYSASDLKELEAEMFKYQYYIHFKSNIFEQNF